jgi:hypothetical protein
VTLVTVLHQDGADFLLEVFHLLGRGISDGRAAEDQKSDQGGRLVATWHGACSGAALGPCFNDRELAEDFEGLPEKLIYPIVLADASRSGNLTRRAREGISPLADVSG